MFSKPNFVTSPSFEGLRKILNQKYEFSKGFVMNASEFADVKEWPLTFSILRPKK
jgi:hypothetical protein